MVSFKWISKNGSQSKIYEETTFDLQYASDTRLKSKKGEY